MNNRYGKGADRPHGCSLPPKEHRQTVLPTGEPVTVLPEHIIYKWMSPAYWPIEVGGYKKAVEAIGRPIDKWAFKRALFKNYTVAELFDWLEIWYSEKVAKADKFFVTINTPEGLIEFCPPQRFSKQYASKVLYRLWNIRDVPMYSFWTLTVPAVPSTGKAVDYHDRMLSVPHRWANFRAYAKRNGIEFDYLRTFELQKNGQLHVHFGCYTELSNSHIELLMRYWYPSIGFVRVYVYAGGFKYQSFITEKSLKWIPEEFDGNASSQVTSYIWKYMLKEPSYRDRAIMLWFRVRTYSVSKGLKPHLRAWVARTDIEFVKSGYKD